MLQHQLAALVQEGPSWGETLNAGTFGFNISSYTASSAVTFEYDGASAVAISTAMPTR